MHATIIEPGMFYVLGYALFFGVAALTLLVAKFNLGKQGKTMSWTPIIATGAITGLMLLTATTKIALVYTGVLAV